MASKSCTTCLRALRWHNSSVTQQYKRTLSHSSRRAFTTTPSFYADPPKQNATPSQSPPSGTEQRAEAGKDKSKATLSRKALLELKKLTGKSTDTYIAYGATEMLYKECTAQADYSIPQAADPDAEMPKTEEGEDLGVSVEESWWHTDLGLKPTFSTWSQVTMLHMYLLSARFRCFPPDDYPIWQQHLLDHFFYEAEDKMVVNHNMHARGTRNRYLKDLFLQWRGLLVSYDEGVVKGDAVLAAAIWRNVLKADENADLKGLALIVSYMRTALCSLDAMPDAVVAAGKIDFGSPREEMEVVGQRSKLMDMPFQQTAGAQQTKAVA